MEIGCLEGVLLEHLRYEGYEVMGYEPNEETANLHPFVIPCGFESNSLKDNSVASVISFHVFEHLIDPVKSAKEIHRVLRQGGIAMMEVPVDDFDFYNPDHYHFFREESLRELLKDFKDIHTSRDTFITGNGDTFSQIVISGRKET